MGLRTNMYHLETAYGQSSIYICNVELFHSVNTLGNSGFTMFYML